jgi:uncharacterized membrane protein
MSETHAGQLEPTYQAEAPTTWRAGLLSLSGLTLLLSVVGAGIAGYLTYVHYDESVLVCTAGGGCHTVQQSAYATIGPIPIAMLGLGMFLTLGALALVRILDWKAISADTAVMLSWGITLSALLYYAYLVYVELFVLEAVCQWCVGTTAITVAIFAIASFQLRDALAITEEDLAD